MGPEVTLVDSAEALAEAADGLLAELLRRRTAAPEAGPARARCRST